MMDLPAEILYLRPNKRWLAKRRKGLLAEEPGESRDERLRLVELAIEAMSTAEGAAAFKKQCRETATARRRETGVSIVGHSTTGKSYISSASGRRSVRKAQDTEVGGLQICVKPDDVDPFREYAKGAGRLDDIILLNDHSPQTLKETVSGTQIPGSVGAGKTKPTKAQRQSRKSKEKPRKPA